MRQNDDQRLKHYARLDLITARRHRNRAVHWTAFSLAVMSFVLLVSWMAGARGAVPTSWAGLDIGLGAVFAVEFFTRSGFRWKPASYVVTHFFDFAAIAPALVLVNHGYPFQGPWIWLIVVARGIRAVDRLFGDGFVQRNALALVEGFEEEITDRVLVHRATRIQADVARGHFAQAMAQALERNKDSVLKRIKAEHPQDGLVAHVAQAIGLDEALERAEERTYDAITSIVSSAEFDKAVSDALDAAFLSLREQIGVRTWRQHLGFRPGTSWPEDMSRT